MSNYSDFVRDRAIETLERTEPDPEDVAEDEARRRRNRELDASEKWDATNPRGLTPGRMNQTEYDAWHAAGCPPLGSGFPTAPLPPPSEKRTTPPPSGDAVTKKWVLAQIDTLAKATGVSMGRFGGKHIKPLIAEIEQARNVNDALGRQVDKILAELAELKREAALAKRLEEQKLKRQADMLQLENRLLVAGHRPSVAREAVEDAADLPDFRDWRNAQ